MIINIFVNKPVWSVYNPAMGFLLKPCKDYIKEIDNTIQGAILQENNNLDTDDQSSHWSNDYYGNLVSYEYLFETYDEAASFLIKHYENELFIIKTRMSQLIFIIDELSIPV